MNQPVLLLGVVGLWAVACSSDDKQGARTGATGGAAGVGGAAVTCDDSLPQSTCLAARCCGILGQRFEVDAAKQCKTMKTEAAVEFAACWPNTSTGECTGSKAGFCYSRALANGREYILSTSTLLDKASVDAAGWKEEGLAPSAICNAALSLPTCGVSGASGASGGGGSGNGGAAGGGGSGNGGAAGGGGSGNGGAAGGGGSGNGGAAGGGGSGNGGATGGAGAKAICDDTLTTAASCIEAGCCTVHGQRLVVNTTKQCKTTKTKNFNDFAACWHGENLCVSATISFCYSKPAPDGVEYLYATGMWKDTAAVASAGWTEEGGGGLAQPCTPAMSLPDCQ